MEGSKDNSEESKGKLNPDAIDFTPKDVPEETKHNLKADAATFEPTANVIIESYETHPTTHCKTAEKFEGRYGMANFVLGESFVTHDPIEDSWTTYTEWTAKSKVPDGKYSRAVFTNSNSFIITGGFNGTALKHSYHIEISNNFGTISNIVNVYEMQEPRYLHSSVMFNSLAYVIGGQSSPNEYLSSVEAFDGQAWITKSPLNRPRSYCAVIANNSALWVAGGFCGTAEVCNSLEKFQDNTWLVINVNIPMLAGMSVVPRDKFNSSFLVLGGSDGNHTSERVLCFNTENSQFEEDGMKLLHPRAGATVCWYLNSFWVVGGGHVNGEFWSNGVGKEMKNMPLSIYQQIEAAAFMKAKE